jgi:hypothetical protein
MGGRMQDQRSTGNGMNTSHSPESHTSTHSGKKIMLKGNQKGKSPYLNDCFNKFQIGQNSSQISGDTTGGNSSKSA